MKQKYNFIFSVYQFNVLINKENIIKDTKAMFIKNRKIAKINFCKSLKKYFLENEQKYIDIGKYNLYN